MSGLHHLVIIETAIGRQRDAPTLFESLADCRICDTLVARKGIRHRANVACALHVIMTPQGVGAAAGPHIVAGHQQQV